MNIIKIIKFIGEKNPKYSWDKIENLVPLHPVDGKGYIDENGMKQGEWVDYWGSGFLFFRGAFVS